MSKVGEGSVSWATHVSQETTAASVTWNHPLIELVITTRLMYNKCICYKSKKMWVKSMVLNGFFLTFSDCD